MPTAAERWPHLYKTARYQRGRRNHLAENPYCKMCEDEGVVRAAVELDHIQPHNGDPVLFWDIDNWQGLCRHHHRSVKARMERGGTRPGCDADGIPLDPNHPWRQ